MLLIMLHPGLGIIRIRYNGYNLSLHGASTPVNRSKDTKKIGDTPKCKREGVQ